MKLMPLLAAALLAAPIAAHAQASDPAVQQIDAYERAVTAAARQGGSEAARVSRFEPIVRSYYDMPAIASLVAGPAWAKASAAEKSAAIAALVRHSAVSLARNFTGAPNFKVDPAPIDRSGRKVVKVSVGDHTLLYLMDQDGGQWKIVDVVAGGVSQLALERSDLASTLAAGGVPAMVKKLAQVDGR